MRPSCSLSRWVPTLLRSRVQSDLTQVVTVATPGKIHRHRPASLPPPSPYLFPQTVILADGSSFTLMTTSPRSVYKLTRDMSNHPDWYPNRATSRDLRDEFGRIGKFKEQYAASKVVARGRRTPGGAVRKVEKEEEDEEEEDAYAGGLEDWMSEGAVEMKENMKQVRVKSTSGKGKGKR